MSFEALAVSVLIASPGDVEQARDAVERAIRIWNVDRAHDSGVVLLPLRWELDAVSDFKLATQSAINVQIVDHADIVIGLFDSRLGTPTVQSVSGTVEELERSAERGARVHVYFSDMPLPRNLDIDQFVALRKFQDKSRKHSFINSYLSIADLTTKVRTALERDVGELLRSIALPDDTQRPYRAVLQASCCFEDLAGREAADEERVDSPRGRWQIEVQNTGSVLADNVLLEVRVKPGEGDPPINRLDDLEGVRIQPLEAWKFPVYPTLATASVWQVGISWEEEGLRFHDYQTVRCEGLID